MLFSKVNSGKDYFKLVWTSIIIPRPEMSAEYWTVQPQLAQVPSIVLRRTGTTFFVQDKRSYAHCGKKKLCTLWENPSLISKFSRNSWLFFAICTLSLIYLLVQDHLHDHAWLSSFTLAYFQIWISCNICTEDARSRTYLLLRRAKWCSHILERTLAFFI